MPTEPLMTPSRLRLRARAALRALLGLRASGPAGIAAHGGARSPRLLSALPAGRFRTLATVPELAGQPGSWVQVMMCGAFTDPRYGDFVIDRAYLEALVTNYERLDLTVPIDRDHSPYTTGSTEAVGWVKQLRIRDDETLWAYVVWTEAGAELILSGSYRYFSPEFVDDYEDKYGETFGPALLGGGLTNRPFLTGMAEVSLALHSSQSLGTLQRDTLVLSAGQAIFLSARPANPSKEKHVDRETLITLYGLQADATDEQILAAATAARQAQLAAAAPATPPPAGDDATPSERETAALERAAVAMARVRDSVIDGAIGDGRLVPALRDHMVKTWDREVEATGTATETEAMIAAMPKVLTTGARGAGSSTAAATAADAEELPADATRAEKLEAKAKALMVARPGLSYRDAVYEADALVPEERRHVLSAFQGAA